MSKLDADLHLLETLLDQRDQQLLARAPELADTVRLARQALTPLATDSSRGFSATTHSNETVTGPDGLPIRVHIEITTTLDEPTTDPPLMRRCGQLAEALDEAVAAQLRLLRAAND